MKKFIAAALFVATQWQPANAQAILGSIPEEFRGDWCWQENTNGEQIFRPGACKPKADSLNIDRMTLDRGRLSCVFDSGTASDDTRCRRPPGRMIAQMQVKPELSVFAVFDRLSKRK